MNATLHRIATLCKGTEGTEEKQDISVSSYTVHPCSGACTAIQLKCIFSVEPEGKDDIFHPRVNYNRHPLIEYRLDDASLFVSTNEFSVKCF